MFIVVTCIFCATMAQAADTVIDAGLEYTLDASTMTASVKASDLNIRTADILAKISVEGKDYAVTSIADMAFFRCDNLESVTFPASLANVGIFAFMNCTTLKEVHAPGIEEWLSIYFANAFGNPLMYAHDLYIGSERIVDLIIPDGTRQLSDAIFAGMSMESVSIPASVKEIGGSAFYECTMLKSIEIPGTVETIGTSAFVRCTALTDVVLADGLTMVGRYMFDECSALKTVRVPASVTEMGVDCFKNCNALERVDIDDVDAWMRIRFANQDANPVNYSHTLYVKNHPLETLTIDSDITAIPDNIFTGLKTLRQLTLGDKVLSIGEKAFMNCENLEKVTLGNSIQSIGNCAFAGCSGLEDVVFAPSLIRIGDSAFEECIALKDLRLGQTAVESLGKYCFYGCESLGSIELPPSLTAIPDAAFGECTSLEHLPDMTVSSIGFGAFSYCSALKSTGNINVETIGKSAFLNCRNLMDVTVTGVSKFATFAFSGCDNLSKLEVDAIDPPAAESNTFSGYSAALYVPQTSIERYRAHEIWSLFTKIGALGGVADATFADISMQVDGNSIVFDGVTDGVFVEVYDTSGRRIYRGEACTITPGRGIFIVRYAGTSTKVFVP